MRRVFRWAVPAALLVALPQGADAQARGSLAGRVYDSLFTRAPLPGAEVYLVGLERAVRADSAGRYLFDSLPPGRYRVSFVHEVLDRSGLGAPVLPVDVLADEQAELPLSLPSGATIYARSCPEPRAAGTGLLVGHVTRDGVAVAGAAVRALWRQWTLEPGREPEDRARDATLTVDESGRFALCGLPADRVVTLAAEADGQRVQRELRFAGEAFAVVQLQLERSAGVATGPVAVTADAPDDGVSVVGEVLEGRTVLRGRALDREGKPVKEARATLVGTSATAQVRDDGTFQFAQVPAEVQTVEVAAIGFVPRRVEVDLRPGRLARADVVLEKVAYVLQPLNIDAASPERVALERRLRLGNGQFLTADQIRRRSAISVSDLLKGMLGVQVQSVGLSTVVVMSRGLGAGRSLGGQCIPAYFVDGVMVGTETQVSVALDSLLYATGGQAPGSTRASAEGTVVGTSGLIPRDVGPDQFVNPNDIETLEVYNSSTQIPPEFSQYNGGCGIVAIWTKRGKPTITEESEGK